MIRKTASTLILAAVLAIGAEGPVAARPASSASLSPADRGRVDAAARYLQGLRSAKAQFTQTDPRGAVTTGVFSLKRPGKARFAYDPPAGLTVVADGVNVDVYDAKLKTFDAYPIKNTPLSMLLGGAVRFDASTVTGVDHDRAGFTITLRDPGKDAEGRLALNFTTLPLALAGWTVTDAQGLKTTVHLSELKAGATLPADLFILKDPRPHGFRP